MARGNWKRSMVKCLLVTLLCCFGYLFASSLVVASWLYPSAPTSYEMALHSEIDVIGVAVKPTCVTKRAVLGLNEFFGPRRIIVVTTSKRACQKFRTFATNVQCVVESGLLPDVSKSAIREFVAQTYGKFDREFFRGRDSSGWYLQQFLKMGASLYIPDLSEYHIIWDLDMILLRELSIFRNPAQHDRKFVINIGGYNKPGYDYSYHNLTGYKLPRASDGTSFVTHWMVVYKPFMLEFLAYLSSRPQAVHAPNGSAWVWAVLSALDPKSLHLGFSEYASYAGWILQHHRDSVYEMPIKTWIRDPFGSELALSVSQQFSGDVLCCPTDFVLAALNALQYQYCGFEIGHYALCDYNNPKFEDGYGV